ncbi:MAG: radical SAM protein [Clostridia bacterium]|jgi:radical SAM protein with 4Fe4S-binding SPASM domain
MIDISRLYLGLEKEADRLRYERPKEQRKPVVVFSATKRCNLKCCHCYAHSPDGQAEPELTTAQAKALIDDLSAFGSPVMLFSGGEPLMRTDMPELMAYAVERKMRATLSTNGTLITEAMARELKKVGLTYAGISLDGLAAAHDSFRGVDGAFDKALAGIRACKKAGIKVGLRLTLTRSTVEEIDNIFRLMVDEDIPRICFYHLVYTKDSPDIRDIDLSHEESRAVFNRIVDITADLHAKGIFKEVLTVDNACDGPALYLRLLKEDPVKAEKARKLLEIQGGDATGTGIACVDWTGKVFANQFWRHHSFGNVLERPFREIWMDRTDPLMDGLKDKANRLKGRCGACRFRQLCMGSSRVRAEAVDGDPWAADPACYLSDEEIGVLHG